MTQSFEQPGFDIQNEDTLKDKYLTFSLAEEDYGIEIRHVIEIIGIQKITKVPNLPAFIKGVINLRGKVIPVMDVRARFNLEARDYDERTCIVVVDIDGEGMGLVVDHVNEVAGIPEAQVEPPPASPHSRADHYISGIGKMEDEVKILLNVERLIGRN
jgi:purine-binding chemotaxis protein CheW